MKLLKLILAGSLFIAVGSVTLNADAIKGQKLFSKKVKKSCGMTGAKFASKHSQDEWETIKEAGNFEAEIMKICPKVKEGQVKEKWIGHIYDFSRKFANDSGEVPSC